MNNRPAFHLSKSETELLRIRAKEEGVDMLLIESEILSRTFRIAQLQESRKQCEKQGIPWCKHERRLLISLYREEHTFGNVYAILSKMFLSPDYRPSWELHSERLTETTQPRDY
jgi:hypothetical protein